MGDVVRQLCETIESSHPAKPFHAKWGTAYDEALTTAQPPPPSPESSSGELKLTNSGRGFDRPFELIGVAAQRHIEPAAVS